MGRGKRSGVVLSEGGGRLPRLSPFQVSPLSAETLVGRFAELEEDIDRGVLWGFLRALRELPPAALHSPGLEPYWTRAAEALLADPEDQLCEAPARRYLTALDLVESTTPYVVFSRGSKNMLHLRAEADGERTLCGVAVLSGWVKQAERGAFAAALEGRPLARDQKACRRCARHLADSPGSESPRYAVLAAKTRQEMIDAASAAVRAFVLGGRWTSESNVLSGDYDALRSAARDAAMAALRREVALWGVVRGRDWLIDHWFDGYYLRRPLTDVYGDEIPIPDADFLAEALAVPNEGTLAWQPHLRYIGTTVHLIPRVALSCWSEALPHIVASFAGYRVEPYWLKRIKEEVGDGLAARTASS